MFIRSGKNDLINGIKKAPESESIANLIKKMKNKTASTDDVEIIVLLAADVLKELQALRSSYSTSSAKKKAVKKTSK